MTLNLCAELGKDIVDVRTVQRWFSWFRADNKDLKDEGRTYRPSTFNEDFLKSLIQDDPYITTRELEEKMCYDHKTIARQINAPGYVQKLSRWVPHDLSDFQLANRKNKSFLDRLITEDEKWITYDNSVRKIARCLPCEKAPVVAKPGIQREMRMLCIWWNRSGAIYYEFLPHGQDVSADFIRKRPTLANRKGIIFQQDKARPHVALKTRKKLDELCYEILSHPAYLPNVAPSDYHLFLSLQNFLNGRSFRNDDEVKSALSEYFSKKDRIFFESEIDKLPNKWRHVVNNNRQYMLIK
uniref:Histone-lysine N-methyltransferase SETMAR (inferred by orthology to a human protein) n=1 Tax=Strongyloides venezuelensis TaxID=75913 RepID=A0A0K0FCL9_STRVS